MTRFDNETGVAGVSLPSLGRDIALIGRDDTLQTLEAELKLVKSDAFRVALVSGAGGVGKTRVVAEILAKHANDALVMSARSYRLGGATSFGPWVEALDRHLRSRSAEQIRQLCGPALDDLAALLPSVGKIAEGKPDDPNRGRLLDGLAHLFDSLSQERPVLVAFDDLHLADASAWEALRYLGRRLSGAPIGILATARPSGLHSRPISREVLVGLEDDRLLTRIELTPLNRSQVAALAHEVLRGYPRSSTFVPEPLVDWLMERSLGHPLFAIGLLRALADEGADLASPHLEQIPQKLSDRVTLDLQTLDPDRLEVLETLAVIDQRFELDRLQQVTDRPTEQLGLALDALSRAQLVAEHSGGSDLRYEIFHPIIQDVIYEGIGSARKRAIHDKVARVLLDSGQLGAAAAHFARAGVQEDDDAVDALFRAMEQAGERNLYQEALAVLETLLEVLPQGDRRWTRVLDSVTLHSEWVLSHLAETDAGAAIETMTRVIDVLEGSDDVRGQALARFHLAAFLSFGEARIDEAEQACREAVELFRRAGDRDGELLASNELAWIHGCRGDFAANADLSREVLGRAEEEGLAHAAAVAAGTTGFVHGVMGRCDQARHFFDHALELAVEADVSYRVAWSHAQGGHYLALCGHLEQAISFGKSALTEHPSAPDALALEDLGASYWLAGRLSEALEVLEQSAIRRPILGSRRRAWGSAVAARVHGEMGRSGRALSALERATTTYDDWFFIWSSWSIWADGWLAWTRGDEPKALTELGRLSEWLEAAGALGYEPLVLNDISEMAAELGDLELSEHVSRRGSEVAEQSGSPLSVWLASLVAARLHLVRGATQAAIEEATAAGEELDKAGYALLAAGSREVLGRALVSQDRSAATEALQRAAGEFDSCGAVWRRDRTVSTLNELGRPGRRAAAAVYGPESLSPREREVAILTAQGHTAQAVGQKLFIGKRTVETHLANIYAKLGISSKRELIQRSDEFGL